MCAKLDMSRQESHSARCVRDIEVEATASRQCGPTEACSSKQCQGGGWRATCSCGLATIWPSSEPETVPRVRSRET